MEETAYKGNAKDYGLNGPPQGTPERDEWLGKYGSEVAKLTDPNNPRYKDAQEAVKVAGEAAVQKDIDKSKKIIEGYHDGRVYDPNSPMEKGHLNAVRNAAEEQAKHDIVYKGKEIERKSLEELHDMEHQAKVASETAGSIIKVADQTVVAIDKGATVVKDTLKHAETVTDNIPVFGSVVSAIDHVATAGYDFGSMGYDTSKAGPGPQLTSLAAMHDVTQAIKDGDTQKAINNIGRVITEVGQAGLAFAPPGASTAVGGVEISTEDGGIGAGYRKFGIGQDVVMDKDGTVTERTSIGTKDTNIGVGTAFNGDKAGVIVADAKAKVGGVELDASIDSEGQAAADAKAGNVKVSVNADTKTGKADVAIAAKTGSGTYKADVGSDGKTTLTAQTGTVKTEVKTDLTGDDALKKATVTVTAGNTTGVVTADRAGDLKASVNHSDDTIVAVTNMNDKTADMPAKDTAAAPAQPTTAAAGAGAAAVAGTTAATVPPVQETPKAADTPHAPAVASATFDPAALAAAATTQVGNIMNSGVQAVEDGVKKVAQVTHAVVDVAAHMPDPSANKPDVAKKKADTTPPVAPDAKADVATNTPAVPNFGGGEMGGFMQALFAIITALETAINGQAPAAAMAPQVQQAAAPAVAAAEAKDGKTADDSRPGVAKGAAPETAKPDIAKETPHAPAAPQAMPEIAAVENMVKNTVQFVEKGIVNGAKAIGDVIVAGFGKQPEAPVAKAADTVSAEAVKGANAIADVVAKAGLGNALADIAKSFNKAFDGMAGGNDGINQGMSADNAHGQPQTPAGANMGSKGTAIA